MNSDTNELQQKLTSALHTGLVTQLILLVSDYLAPVPLFTTIYLVVSALLVVKLINPASSLQEILQGLLVNSLISLFQSQDNTLTMVNMVSVYLIGSSIHDSMFTGTAQYLFVIRLGKLFDIQETFVVVLLAIGYFYVSKLKSFTRIHDTLSMFIINITQQWFLKKLPTPGKLPLLFLLLHALEPYLSKSSHVVSLYNFLVISATGLLQDDNVPLWIQAVVPLMIWKLHITKAWDDLSERIAVRLLQLYFVQICVSTSQQDLFMVFVLILVAYELFHTFSK